MLQSGASSSTICAPTKLIFHQGKDSGCDALDTFRLCRGTDLSDELGDVLLSLDLLEETLDWWRGPFQE